MRTQRKWSIALLILIIVDSISTVYFGFEANPLILWFMGLFNITLKTAMIIRPFTLLPFVYIVDKYNWSRFTFLVYIIIYVLVVGCMII